VPSKLSVKEVDDLAKILECLPVLAAAELRFTSGFRNSMVRRGNREERASQEQLKTTKNRVSQEQLKTTKNRFLFRLRPPAFRTVSGIIFPSFSPVSLLFFRIRGLRSSFLNHFVQHLRYHRSHGINLVRILLKFGLAKDRNKVSPGLGILKKEYNVRAKQMVW